ncbi:MAG TPA: PD-(D/E)XK nuclease family protein [Thermoanaerobaculia bacterium]|nr:PD-(D/E)XK nuclease family protein [Thermoanaerobaculia bacterium]
MTRSPAAVLIAPYREIAAAVAARLAAAREGSDPLDAWAEEVIVPSRGMAEAISNELLVRTPRGVAGVQIRFLDELARALVNDAGAFPRAASDAERRLAMRMAVRTVQHPMMEGRGVAAMLERSYRDLRDSGLTLDGLSTRGLRNPQRTQAILRAFAEYERLIAQLGAIDPADLLAQAERVAEHARPQLLAGFYDMTGAQMRFVQSLMPRIAAVWIPTDMPFAQPFIERSGGLQPAGSRPAEAGRYVSDAMSYDTNHAELREVCAHVAELLEGGEQSIAITARSLDPYAIHLLNRFAAEHGFATTLPDEIPLAAHRIGRGVLTLLRLRDRGFPRGEVLELVRDGLLARTRIDVDRADYETRRAHIAGGTSEELAPLRNRSRALDEYIALVAELEELTSGLPSYPAARLPSTSPGSREAGKPGSPPELSSLFRVETELDLVAAARLDEIAALFRRTGQAGSPVLHDLIDAIEQVSLTQPPSAGPKVWAGDVMRFRGRSFAHVFVVRMQDDVFPQRRTEDPLFPDSDRRVLGMREIGDGRAEEELLLQLVRESAAHVHFSFASGDGFGKVLRPSRYLRGLDVATDFSRSKGGLKPAPTLLRPLQLLVRSGTRSVFDSYLPMLAETFRARVQSVTPTQLEDFGECPQKFFFKHLLGVQEVEHPERELQIHHREKGSIDHKILERFYRALSSAELANAAAALPRLPDALAARLDTIIDETFDEHEQQFPPFNRTVRGIERRATKRILREFLAGDIAELTASELEPRHFEYRFGVSRRGASDHPEPFIVHAGGVPVRVEGTIDRIDYGGAGLRIVDYKSGKAIRHNYLPEKIDRGVRLQLALYAMAAAEFFDNANVSGTIKPIVTGEQKFKFAFVLEEKRATLLETLEIFLRAITGGIFPAFPNDEDFNSCKYCPVSHSCRTRHDQEERYAVQQHRDPRTLLGGGAP